MKTIINKKLILTTSTLYWDDVLAVFKINIQEIKIKYFSKRQKNNYEVEEISKYIALENNIPQAIIFSAQNPDKNIYDAAIALSRDLERYVNFAYSDKKSRISAFINIELDAEVKESPKKEIYSNYIDIVNKYELSQEFMDENDFIEKLTINPY